MYFQILQQLKSMGNTQVIDNNNIKPHKDIKINNEMREINQTGEQFAQEEFQQTESCCGFQYKKKIRRRIYWENNFVANCNSVRDQYRWAGQLIDLISSVKQSKLIYFREVNNLKKQITFQNSSFESERDVIMSPAELDLFKSNIKRSVLLTSSQTSKFFQENANKSPTGTMHQGRQSRIQITKFRNTINNKSPQKRRQSTFSSASKNGLRKSIMSFVDDTLSSVFGNEREVSKKTAKDLQIFLKFSMIVQKHLNDPNCMLYRIKKRFIDSIVKTYSENTDISKIDKLIDGINQFMLILKQGLIDYYNLNSFADDSAYTNPFITNQQNTISLCNSIFFKDHAFYQTVFNFIAKFNQERQRKLKNIFNLLQKQSPQKFFIKDNFCLNYKTIRFGLKDNESIKPQKQYIIDDQPYRSCKLTLNQLQNSKTPVNKMKIILNVSQLMNKNIQKFYQVNGLQRQKWMLDADQVLSIFCYIIVGSKIKNIFTHLFILDHFSTSSQMISIFGYYLSVMNCAVQQLENDYSENQQKQTYQ